MPFPRLRVTYLAGMLLIAATGAFPQVQSQESPSAAARLRAHTPELRITDERLALALERLIAASPTARGALSALSQSGLPVAIGSPAQLAALPESAGGPGADERRALLGSAAGHSVPEELPIAWVVFRASGDTPSKRQPTPGGEVERVWVAVEVDSVEAWIRNAYPHNAASRIEQDLLAILAHEFVAHVGSIAGSRRMEDFCDDPSPLRHESTACSLRVENRARREINRTLGLRGDQALPIRRSYTLEVMHFARARR